MDKSQVYFTTFKVTLNENLSEITDSRRLPI